MGYFTGYCAYVVSALLYTNTQFLLKVLIFIDTFIIYAPIL